MAFLTDKPHYIGPLPCGFNKTKCSTLKSKKNKELEKLPELIPTPYPKIGDKLNDCINP